MGGNNRSKLLDHLCDVLVAVAITTRKSYCFDAVDYEKSHQIWVGGNIRTTVTIEDALYEKALEVADPKMDKADLFREAVKTFVRVQAAKRLAALGGVLPGMKDVPRRGSEALPAAFKRSAYSANCVSSH